MFFIMTASAVRNSSLEDAETSGMDHRSGWIHECLLLRWGAL